MAKVPALQFQKHLNQRGLQPAYVFEGEDDALLSSCLSALKDFLETEDMPGSMTTDLEEVEDARDVFDELHTQPFMGMEGKRLVIVREGKKFISDHKETLQGYLESPSSAGILAVCCDKLDRRYAAAKALDKRGVVVDCSKIRWNQAKSWVAAKAREENKKITSNALSALLEAVGPNVSALRTELEKLVLYAEQDAITEDHVEELVPQSRSRSIFDLSSAIIQSDVPEALRLGERLLLEGESPEGIVAFLGHRMRTLWQVRRMVDEGKDPARISREVGMPRWAAKKSAQAVGQLTERWFVRRIGQLARADVELKSTSVQSREQPVWLNRFLTSLCSQ